MYITGRALAATLEPGGLRLDPYWLFLSRVGGILVSVSGASSELSSQSQVYRTSETECTAARRGSLVAQSQEPDPTVN